MSIELLYFADCPNHEGLFARLGRLLAQAGIDEEIRLVRVESEEEAFTQRFLGSPSVRVDGRDVDPGAEGQGDFGLKCRLYHTPAGLSGAPPNDWVLAALAHRTMES